MKVHPGFSVNNQRIFKVFFKIMIPKAVTEINLQKRAPAFKFNQGITVDQWGSMHHSYEATKMSSLQAYVSRKLHVERFHNVRDSYTMHRLNLNLRRK